MSSEELPKSFENLPSFDYATDISDAVTPAILQNEEVSNTEKYIVLVKLVSNRRMQQFCSNQTL